jgi:hypothetical protein
VVTEAVHARELVDRERLAAHPREPRTVPARGARGQAVEMTYYADHALFLTSSQDEVVRRMREFLLL